MKAFPTFTCVQHYLIFYLAFIKLELPSGCATLLHHPYGDQICVCLRV